MLCAFPCFPVFVMVMRFGLQYAPYLHDCELTHFIEIWNPRLEGGVRVDLQLKPKCMPPVCFFYLFFFFAGNVGGGGGTYSPVHTRMHKNELQKKVPSQHGPITVSLCIYLSVQLCWSTLSAIKSSWEENASQSQLQGEKKRKKRETHYNTFDRTGMNSPLYIL